MAPLDAFVFSWIESISQTNTTLAVQQEVNQYSEGSSSPHS